jgi:hypothetical protein
MRETGRCDGANVAQPEDANRTTHARAFLPTTNLFNEFARLSFAPFVRNWTAEFASNQCPTKAKLLSTNHIRSSKQLASTPAKTLIHQLKYFSYLPKSLLAARPEGTEAI